MDPALARGRRAPQMRRPSGVRARPIVGVARLDARAKAHEPLIQGAIVCVVIASIAYNAFLAFINAQITPITPTYVMAAEGLLLAAAAGLVALTGLGDDDLPSLSIGLAVFLIATVVSMVNGAVFPDAVRHVAIIALFSLLGLRAKFRTVLWAAGIASLLVLATLAVEAFALKTYVDWFQPARYFEATRGLKDPSYNDSGLFANALSFENRFSFGVLGHRASALFLEQVSLANYGAVLLVMLVAFWSRMPPAARLLQVATVAAILLTTDSRIGLILAFAALGGYFLFPRLPAYANIAIAPGLLVLAFVIMAGPEARLEDDVVGRLTLTMRTMGDLDLPALLGLHALEASEFADSGYTYVLYSSTIIGLLLLWAFVSLFIPQAHEGQKRCAYMLGLFFGSSLLVAGTSVFTIKVAALLWLIAGVARRWPDEARGASPEGGEAALERAALNRDRRGISA